MVVGGYRVGQREADSRLADAGLAADERDLALSLFRPFPKIREQREFALAADKLREFRADFRVKPALDRLLAGDLERDDRLRKALGLLRLQPLASKASAQQPARDLRNDDGVRRRQLLETRRQIGSFAGRRDLRRSVHHVVSDDDETGRHPNPHLQGLARGQQKPPDLGDQIEPGANRVFGLVLMRRRISEIGQQPVAQELGDIPAV